MKPRRKSPLSTAVLALLFVPAFAAPAAADGPEVDVEKVSVAGSFLTSRIDANGDGQASSWCTVRIKGGYQGSSMQQCVNEDVFAGVTADCPGGRFVVGPAQGTGVGVRTFPSAEDQVFLLLTEREFCADATGGLAGSDQGIVIGGTGRYQGASGSYSFEYTGQLLYGDETATPPQFFGSIQGSGTYTIERP